MEKDCTITITIALSREEISGKTVKDIMELVDKKLSVCTADRMYKYLTEEVENA